jgi:hypothetical protein
MTLKITFTLDQENEQGTVLVGLLAKALGRGEAGVSNLRIEREGEPVAKPKLSAVAKLVATREIAPPRNNKKHRAPSPGTGAFLGLQIAASGVRNATKALREAFTAAGLSDNGAGATFSKLQTRGYLRNVGFGQWKLTAKGEAVLKEHEHANQKVEHHDSANG